MADYFDPPQIYQYKEELLANAFAAGAATSRYVPSVFQSAVQGITEGIQTGQQIVNNELKNEGAALANQQTTLKNEVAQIELDDARRKSDAQQKADEQARLEGRPTSAELDVQINERVRVAQSEFMNDHELAARGIMSRQQLADNILTGKYAAYTTTLPAEMLKQIDRENIGFASSEISEKYIAGLQAAQAKAADTSFRGLAVKELPKSINDLLQSDLRGYIDQAGGVDQFLTSTVLEQVPREELAKDNGVNGPTTEELNKDQFQLTNPKTGKVVVPWRSMTPALRSKYSAAHYNYNMTLFGTPNIVGTIDELKKIRTEGQRKQKADLETAAQNADAVAAARGLPLDRNSNTASLKETQANQGVVGVVPGADARIGSIQDRFRTAAGPRAPFITASQAGDVSNVPMVGAYTQATQETPVPDNVPKMTVSRDTLVTPTPGAIPPPTGTPELPSTPAPSAPEGAGPESKRTSAYNSFLDFIIPSAQAEDRPVTRKELPHLSREELKDSLSMYMADLTGSDTVSLNFDLDKRENSNAYFMMVDRINNLPGIENAPAIFKGLIAVESRGRADAMSGKKAMGLTQMTDVARRELNNRRAPGEPEITTQDLWDEEKNLVAGAKYLALQYNQVNNMLLKQLSKQGVPLKADPRMILAELQEEGVVDAFALAAYNGGLSAISKGINKGILDWDSMKEHLKTVKNKSAYDENSKYVDKVLAASIPFIKGDNMSDDDYVRTLAAFGIITLR